MRYASVVAHSYVPRRIVEIVAAELAVEMIRERKKTRDRLQSIGTQSIGYHRLDARAHHGVWYMYVICVCRQILESLRPHSKDCVAQID